MSRSGEEMMVELAGLLNNSKIVATAAKKDDDDKKEKKEEKKECKKCKCDPCECDKKDKKDKKEAEAVMGVINDLVKLAGDLDALGEDKASAAVDDALKVIVEGLKKKTAEPEAFKDAPWRDALEDKPGPDTSAFEQPGGVIDPDELQKEYEMGSEMEEMSGMSYEELKQMRDEIDKAISEKYPDMSPEETGAMPE